MAGSYEEAVLARATAWTTGSEDNASGIIHVVVSELEVRNVLMQVLATRIISRDQASDILVLVEVDYVHQLF